MKLITFYGGMRIQKWMFFVIFMLSNMSTSLCEFLNSDQGWDDDINNTTPNTTAQCVHRKAVESYYSNRNGLSTSNLGTILFKNVQPVVFQNSYREAKTYKVAVWIVWTEIIATYFQNALYDSLSVTQEALQKCLVKNCVFYSSYSLVDIASADAVIFTSQTNRFPSNYFRDPYQRWILWSQGHPAHKSTRWTRKGLGLMSGVFNWTMGYRTDSDIPTPYGRTVPLDNPIEIDESDLERALRTLVPYWKDKQTGTLAMTIIDKCEWEYKELSKYFNLDIFWKSCPQRAKTDCTLPEQYLFYVAFEDSSCRQYISETIFHHAYSKGAIPLIIGIPLQDCEKLLPPNSFMHVEQYQNISDLVKDMKEVVSNYAFLLKYHKWRQHFDVVNEHGFFDTRGSQLCRVCEALNYNDGEAKWYNAEDLSLFYNEKLFCDFILECKN